MPATKQRLALPFDLKGVSAVERTFEGYLSTYDIDLGDDRVIPGAFANSLKQWRAANGAKVIPLIDQHHYGSIRSVVGKLIDAREDKVGLWTKWVVVPGADGDEALHRVEGRFVTEMSMGYEPIRFDFEEIEGNGAKRLIRNLREVGLAEGSLVIWAMQPNALIDARSIKAMLAGVDPDEFNDDDRRELRALASRIGSLLRPPTDPAKAAALPVVTDGPTPPDASPAPAADTPKASESEPAYRYADALQQRLLALKLKCATTGTTGA